MLSFIARRFVASLAVLLVASYLVYVLAASSGDPLSDLRQSSLPNKQTLIEQRTALLHLDIPPFLRYFVWLGGVLGAFIGQFNLGDTLDGQHVSDLLGNAMGSTLQLVTGSLLIGIVIGVTLGIVTALRQYSGFDYTVTFISFLFFSLPIFWIAVMLKQFGAIGFNNFLANPRVSVPAIIILSVLSGVMWMGIVGGTARRRLTTFLVAALAAAIVLVYVTLTGWLDNPSLGPVVTTGLSAGAAVIVTVLSTGWANKRSRYTALTVAGLGLVLYYPLHALFEQFSIINIFTVIALIILFAALGGVTGWVWGGLDRWQSVRTGAITGVVVALILLLDRFLASWNIYFTQVANGRPIGTIGAATPDLVGSFWVTGIDSFTHLVLPTVALILASLAGYSRYARASLLEVMNQDYIRTARAKGLTERTVVMRHAFRNALIPITTVIALDFGALISGAIVTENVFAWSGMGALFNQALNKVDLNPIMGFFLVTAIAAITFNFLADILYSALDPRIRVSA
ncbi:MAG: glutathione transport system permease protein [Microbacteriaceae bacterium]|nr:glutathione transport system permease protein [Microbacteriaceae bacterium]